MLCVHVRGGGHPCITQSGSPGIRGDGQKRNPRGDHIGPGIGILLGIQASGTYGNPHCQQCGESQ
ncbi:hypothetical protein EG867_16935 [Enterococcus faecalis]|nr:hypothetical protein EG867_16935 [Enterococcus faecalis]